MNTSILQKCLGELSKDTPDLSYIRGMLETLIEMQSTQKSEPNLKEYFTPNTISNVPYMQPVTDTTPEGQAVDIALATLQSGIKPKLGALTIEKNINLN